MSERNSYLGRSPVSSISLYYPRTAFANPLTSPNRTDPILSPYVSAKMDQKQALMRQPEIRNKKEKEREKRNKRKEKYLPRKQTIPDDVIKKQADSLFYLSKVSSLLFFKRAESDARTNFFPLLREIKLGDMFLSFFLSFLLISSLGFELSGCRVGS